jgi:hypothetical protein
MILHFNLHMTPVTSKTKRQETWFQLDATDEDATLAGRPRLPALPLVPSRSLALYILYTTLMLPMVLCVPRGIIPVSSSRFGTLNNEF